MAYATAILGCLCGGCGTPVEDEVVAYTALDREFSAPIFSAFHRHHDATIRPVVKFAPRSAQGISLVDQIIAERDRPVADVFWNDELLQTIRLQRMGLLEPRDWRLEPGYPAEMMAKDGSWCGFAARGRVLVINRDRLPDSAAYPDSVDDLVDPQWRDRGAIARPLSGTTATHAAVIWQSKGPEAARRWFRQVAENAVVLADNRAVARAVAKGQVAWGLTDTDEAIAIRDERRSVEIVFPDQATDRPGTLRIPNTLSILRGSPHPVAAARLVDFLLTAEIEDRLAMGDSAQLPISRNAQHRPRVLPANPIRWMQVDFEVAAERWDEIAAELTEIFR